MYSCAHDLYFLHRRRLAASDGLSRIFEIISVESRLLFRNSPRNKTFVPHTVYNTMHTYTTRRHTWVRCSSRPRPTVYYYCCTVRVWARAPSLVSVSRNHCQALIGLPRTLGTFNDIVRFANSQQSWPSLRYSHKFTTVLKRFSRQITRRLHRCALHGIVVPSK